MNKKYKVALFSECFGKCAYGGPVSRHYHISKVFKQNNVEFNVFGFNPSQVHPSYKLKEAIGGWPINLKEYNIFWVEQGFNSVYKLNKLGILPILGCNLLPNSFPQHCLPYLDNIAKNRQESSITNEKKWMSTLKGKMWLSQSDFQEKEYYRLGLPLNSTVHRAYNPIPTNVFKPLCNVKKNDVFTVGWIGKMNAAKAPRILKEIAQKLPHIIFKYISNEACDMKFTSNVIKILNNENNKMPEVLNTCNLFISTSITENQPTACLEAMACEIPVIGHRTSGMPEIIEHNITGRLVDLANIEHFCIEIERLRMNPLFIRILGQNARKLVIKKYSYEFCFEQYCNIFDVYLNKTRSY